MLDTSTTAYFEGLCMAFMFYFYPIFWLNFLYAYSLAFCHHSQIQLGQTLDYFGPKSKGQAKLYTSRRDANNLIDTEVGSERFTDSCRLGLLIDLSFSEKLKEHLGRKTPEQKRVL